MLPYRPGFGYTLALKGAFDEQRKHRPPHCEDGCYGCDMQADMIFELWLNEQYRSNIHQLGAEEQRLPVGFYFPRAV
jgi:hypothetical protein